MIAGRKSSINKLLKDFREVTDCYFADY